MNTQKPKKAHYKIRQIFKFSARLNHQTSEQEITHSMETVLQAM